MTQEEFDRFKQHCECFIKKCGLLDWDIDIVYRKLEPLVPCETRLDFDQRTAMIKGSTEHVDNCDMEVLAKHEIGHILVGGLAELAKKRFVNEAEIDREWEAIVTRLENVL